MEHIARMSDITPSQRASSSGLRIEIQPRSQHSDGSTVDDWSGVTDPKIRRRVQNRLNQRAYRARKETNTRDNWPPKKRDTPNHVTNFSQSTPPVPTIAQIVMEIARLRSGSAAPWTWAPSNLQELMKQFECKATASYFGGSPQVDHLISLSRLNVWRAANTNILAAGMSIDCLWGNESVSMFCSVRADDQHGSVPSSLQPTMIQKTVVHHPWLDVFPFAAMRDNFIRKGSELDDAELCHDLIGFWDNGRSDATLLVWGVPWDPSNWEATEAFARKWGWTLKGCPEILRSTNYWRAQRGEKPLVWRHVLSSI